MSEEQQTGGQEPQSDGDSGEQAKTFDAAYVKKLRDEAASWRTKVRDLESTVGELQPLAEQFKEQEQARKSEAEKLAEQMAGLQAKLAETERQAAESAKRASVIALASKVGVSTDVVELLDLSKIDLNDEDAALAALGKFKTQSAAGQSSSNPSRQDGGSDAADWWANRNKGKTIFGG